MAKRKRRKRGQSSFSWRGLLRADVAGIGLFLLGGITLLSLLSPTRSNLSEAWVRALRVFLGAGVWLAPLSLLAVGLWLILLATGRPLTMGWRRPLGLSFLGLTFLGLAHVTSGASDLLALAKAGQGGGILGYSLSAAMWQGLGPAVTFALFFLLALVGTVLLTGHNLDDVLRFLVMAWVGLESRLEDLMDRPRYEIRSHTAVPSNGSQVKKLVKQVKSASANATMSAATSTTPAPVPAPRIIGGATSQANAPSVWRLPRVDEVLDDTLEQEGSQAEIRERVHIIETTLESFGVPAQVIEVNQGPAVTQFGVEPGFISRKGRAGKEEQRKVSVRKIESLINDLALALAASPIRIEAPVPGRSIVGIEVPNMETALVPLRGAMESVQFQTLDGRLKLALGQDVSGQAYVTDLTKMPHLLIAGATGSGKSVCVNSVIACLLCTNTPETLRFVMIDPKMVEMSMFNGIPHLISEVVVDVERAVRVLQWTTSEMDRRYKLLSKAGARHLEAYNEKQTAKGEPILHHIVIIIDELADLMMSAPEEVERTLCRLAQMARAVGMHLILATQRPSVDVVTGLIKANFPARIAFAVVSQTDSRVILDTTGADRLLGQGDMLYMAPDASALQRLQGSFVSDSELVRLVDFWRKSGEGNQRETGGRSSGRIHSLPAAIEDGIPTWQPPLWEAELETMLKEEKNGEKRDALYDNAVEVVRAQGRASITMLQRRLRIGYARAARLIDTLESDGIIGPEEGKTGNRGRPVLLSADEGEGAQEDGAEESSGG